MYAIRSYYEQIDMVLTGSEEIYDTPEKILKATIVNAFGDLIQVGDVADLVYSQGMPQINHLERKRTITLQVTPPKTVPIQEAMDTIQNNLITPMQKEGKLQGLDISIGGNADKLVETGQALKWNLVLALLITYLLMSYNFV